MSKGAASELRSLGLDPLEILRRAAEKAKRRRDKAAVLLPRLIKADEARERKGIKARDPENETARKRLYRTRQIVWGYD